MSKVLTIVVRRKCQKYLLLKQKATEDNQMLQDLAPHFPRTLPLRNNIKIHYMGIVIYINSQFPEYSKHRKPPKLNQLPLRKRKTTAYNFNTWKYYLSKGWSSAGVSEYLWSTDPDSPKSPDSQLFRTSWLTLASVPSQFSFAAPIREFNWTSL